jgi:hypothetical protein
MISLLGGEFSCTPYDVGSLAAMMPATKGKVDLSCRAPIPPNTFGNGPVGYIVAHTNRKLSQVELETLKLELLTLSMFIYGEEVRGAKDVRMLP